MVLKRSNKYAKMKHIFQEHKERFKVNVDKLFDCALKCYTQLKPQVYIDYAFTLCHVFCSPVPPAAEDPHNMMLPTPSPFFLQM